MFVARIFFSLFIFCYLKNLSWLWLSWKLDLILACPPAKFNSIFVLILFSSYLGLPTIRICVFMAGKNWNSVGLLYFSRTSLSLTFNNWFSHFCVCKWVCIIHAVYSATLIMLMIGWEPLCFSSCSSEQSSSIKLSSSSSSSFFSFGVRVKSREGKVLAREGAKWKSCSGGGTCLVLSRYSQVLTFKEDDHIHHWNSCWGGKRKNLNRELREEIILP